MSKLASALTTHPEIIIFDVDGVLVDVRGSFHKTVLETVHFFTGKRVTRTEFQSWKSRPGFNDDWKLSTAWVQSLGGTQTYDEVKNKFVELYWGKNGRPGNVAGEKSLSSTSSNRVKTLLILEESLLCLLSAKRGQPAIRYPSRRCDRVALN